MTAFLIPFLAWGLLLGAIVVDAEKYKKAHPWKKPVFFIVNEGQPWVAALTA